MLVVFEWGEGASAERGEGKNGGRADGREGEQRRDPLIILDMGLLLSKRKKKLIWKKVEADKIVISFIVEALD